MRHIILSCSRIIDTESKRKLYVSNEFLFLILCIIFNIFGTLLTVNEFQGDAWVFQGFADGLFGENNKSIITICSNYLIMGIVYLLSLTGLRLFWYNILLIFCNFVSSYLVCKVIGSIVYERYKYLLCSLFLMLVNVLAYFHMYFTVVAAFTISAGCLWIFYSLELHKGKKYLIFGVVWVILGAGLRFDCIAFPVVLMGIVWIFKVIKITYEILTSTKNDVVTKILLIVKRYFTPFCVALLLVVGIEITQQYLIEYVNPGFRDWNALRGAVDLYQLPDYDSHIYEYQEIGFSRNDYNLSRSLNNYDPEVFTNQMYKNLLDIKEKYYKNLNDSVPFGTFLLDQLRSMSGSLCFIIGIVIIILSLLYWNIWVSSCCFTLFVCAFAFRVYFAYTDRLIDRIEWSIWIAMLLAMVASFLVLGKGKNLSDLKLNIKRYLVLFLCLIAIIIHPNNVESSRYGCYRGMSMLDIYKERFKNQLTYGRFLYNLSEYEGEVLRYGTHDEIGQNYLMQHKDTLFLVALNRSEWLQSFPLPGIDLLRTAPIGTCANWLPIGEYLTHLRVIKQIYKNWHIENPFRSMTDNNVRVVFKDTELYYRSHEIYAFLLEHYYADANFSVEAVENRTVIGRFMRNFDKKGLLHVPGNVVASFSVDSGYLGMSKISITDVHIYDFLPSLDKAFIEIHSEDGNTYTCTVMNDNGQLCVLLYDDILAQSGDYTADFIYSHGSQLYTVEMIIH